jgi:quercetin dioxygenase-like cupin family protein
LVEEKAVKTYSRRDLGLLLPALAAAVPATAQQSAAPKEPPKRLSSKAYVFEDLPAKKNGDNVGRAVLNGLTHKDYPVELHMTELAAGQQPHPPHQHLHEEILMLRSGQLEVTMNGETTRLTPGSVVFVASNDLHGWKNPGTTPAQYFVMALSGDTA